MIQSTQIRPGPAAARVLTWLGGRLERQARLRTRRQAAKIADLQAHRLPQATLDELARVARRARRG